MKMYHTPYSLDKIQEREVIRETDACVFIASTWKKGKEEKQLKRDAWFSTWEQAHEFLISKAESAEFYAKKSHETAQRKLAAIRALKNEASE